MNEEKLTSNGSYTVLCVDDEANILKSMKRLLYKKDYQLLLAESGARALELMEQHDVHLIMSDMKMPAMSGAELLEKVAINYPETYRILLTGYSDMKSTIDAVNKGKIHRYLQKPWNNEEVITTIDEGLEKIQLKSENSHLQGLVKKQNELLKDLNHNLEDKIKLRTKQIRIALQKIERNNSATQKVLYNLISINPNLDGGFANSVSILAKRIAEKLSLTEQQITDVTYAALLCEIGLLGIETTVYKKAYNELNYSQQQEYIDQIKMAKLVLSPAVHLQNVCNIVTSQFEQINGNGPTKLKGEDIPIEAKILAVARDYWRYSMGRINPTKMGSTESKKEMKKFTGTRYDTEVLDVLLNNPEIVSSKYIETPMLATDLKPGMVLKYNIFTDNHILVLPEEHVFTEGTILKLIQFEKSQSSPITLIVKDTD